MFGHAVKTIISQLTYTALYIAIVKVWICNLVWVLLFLLKDMKFFEDGKWIYNFHWKGQ